MILALVAHLLGSRHGADAPQWLVLGVIAVTIPLVVWGHRKRKQRLASQREELALVSGLVPDETSPAFESGTFEMFPKNTVYSHMMRDPARPHEHFAFLGRCYVDKIHISRTAAVVTSTRRYPHLRLLRAGLLERFDRSDIDIGDEEFDERWTVKCEDPTFARTGLELALRTWLMMFDDTYGAPQFEVNGHLVLAAIEGEDLSKVPEVMALAETFARHLDRSSQPGS